MMSTSPRVTVLGAGVIGLTTALVLAEAGFRVNIVARDLPEDSDSQGFASPWAGADWHPFAGAEDERQKRWETVTYKKLSSLIPQGVVMVGDAIDYFTDPDPSLHWFKDLTPNYRRLDSSELPLSNPMIKAAIRFDGLSLNAPEYTKWLGARVRALGVPITRATVLNIDEPFLDTFMNDELGLADIVVNASSLGSRSLGGVEDLNVFPTRGQTVLVWAPHFKKLIGLKSSDPNIPPTYIIPRPNGGVVLGGTHGAHDWNLSPDQATTERIVKNAFALDPTLAVDPSAGPESIPIISVRVGLRPSRVGGARVERETISVPLERKPYLPVGKGARKSSQTTVEVKRRNVQVIHAYGFGPAGFQSSWGAAEDVLQMVKAASTEQSGW